MHSNIQKSILLAASLVIAGCGGGNGHTNSPPIASASAPSTADVSSPITLSGGSSTDPDGDKLTYSWTLITKPDGSNSAVSEAANVDAKIVTDVAGMYKAQLVVSDGVTTSPPAFVTFEAKVSPQLFIEMVKTNTCIASPKIYLIDKNLVFVTGRQTCSDMEPFALFNSTPEKLLCSGAGLILPRKCTEPKYLTIFEIAIANPTLPNLGLVGSTVVALN